MNGRSDSATPATRHIPLLLTVLVSAVIHVLLLAAGWALIRSSQEISPGSQSLNVTLGEDRPATIASSDPVQATSASVPPADADADVADIPVSAPEAASLPVVDPVLTTTAEALLAEPPVAEAPLAEAALAEAPPTAPTAEPAFSSQRALSSQQALSSQRALSAHEQQRLQQALAQLLEPGSPVLSQADDTLILPDGSRFAIDVQAVTVPGLTDLARYQVTLSQRQDGQVFATRAIVQERAFSWYAKFVNSWDAAVVLASDTVVGRFHSNTPVNFSTDRHRQPVFSGPVSIAGYQGVSRRLRSSGMFRHGIETGTDEVAMPDAAVPTVFTLAEESLEVHRFGEDTRLSFLADGGFGWSQSGSRAGIIRPAPGNAMLIVADEDAVLELSGIVSGVVSVFAPRRLSIIGNLRYADALAGANSQQSFLTLISNGIIEVAGPAQTEPGDLEIQAALFARQRFSVRRFNSRPQGELIIHGTLVAGSVSATEPRFTTRIEYDPRFESVRPPAFPTTGLFDIEDWDRQWRITAMTDELPAIAPDTMLPAVVE